MHRYKLIITYDGTAYAGWQVQPSNRTIQAELESALHTLTGENITVHGSGRTDQGVHAAGQVAHIDLGSERDSQTLCTGLNALLPADIRVLKALRVPKEFHARRSAISKEYRYFIWNGEIMPPFIRKYRAHIRKTLNVDAMKTAASHLVGRHDFAAFSANPNREVESTVRRLISLTVRRRGNEVLITARGDGFLYKMVRSLVGFLVRVGEGAVSQEETKAILLSRARTARVPTAPPEGLFLWRVYYPRIRGTLSP